MKELLKVSGKIVEGVVCAGVWTVYTGLARVHSGVREDLMLSIALDAYYNRRLPWYDRLCVRLMPKRDREAAFQNIARWLSAGRKIEARNLGGNHG